MLCHCYLLEKPNSRLCFSTFFRVFFSPSIVKWVLIIIILTLTNLQKLHSRSVHLVLAYPQVELDINIYMELPPWIVLPHFNKKDYLSKLEHDLYGLKQVGFNWHESLKQDLLDLGFSTFFSNPCIFNEEWYCSFCLCWWLSLVCKAKIQHCLYHHESESRLYVDRWGKHQCIPWHWCCLDFQGSFLITPTARRQELGGSLLDAAVAAHFPTSRSGHSQSTFASWRLPRSS